MKYWLMKSEPDEFSIDDLARKKKEPWSGVRNYQARNYLREMRVGDGVLFYHSSCDEPGVAGIAEVMTDAHPDPTQFDPKSDYYDPASPPNAPRWDQVDVQFVKAFEQPLSIEKIRGLPALGDMVLVKNTRLSVQPVRPEEWQYLIAQLK